MIDWVNKLSHYYRRIAILCCMTPDLYQDMVSDGVAKECARDILPLATPTRMYMHGTVRSWIHYCDLRMANGTQYEHKLIARSNALKSSNNVSPWLLKLMNLVFDLETDGLLDDFSQIHCLCIHDLDTKETTTFNDIGTGSDSIVRGAEYLADADHIIGHNAIGFDCPVLSRIYPWWKPSGQVLDTLLLSRLYHPNRYDLDEKRYGNKKGDDVLPLRLWGTSLTGIVWLASRRAQRRLRQRN